jgi:S-adenosylhomocysteine hydrolase
MNSSDMLEIILFHEATERLSQGIKPTQSFEFDRMVATRAAVASFAADAANRQPDPYRILLSSHLEAKLAAWAIMLRDAGVEVALAPSNAASTVDIEAAEIEQLGIPVFHRPDYHQISDTFWRQVVAFRPNLVFDDGALLIRNCITHHTDLPGMKGAVEFTTSGHENLDEMSSVGLPWPVFDLGLSYCKHEIGNVYGTGISTMTAISYATT